MLTQSLFFILHQLKDNRTVALSDIPCLIEFYDNKKRAELASNTVNDLLRDANSPLVYRLSQENPIVNVNKTRIRFYCLCFVIYKEVLFIYCSAKYAAFAPSASAVTICLNFFVRTSPATKTPFRFV